MTLRYPYALPFDNYREAMAIAYSRISGLAPHTLQATVPACPGWTGEDLLRHLGLVYISRAETIRTGKRPPRGWTAPLDSGTTPALAFLDACFSALVAELDSHSTDDAAESWVAEDQTVGFWVRRLTHETTIHRHDLESAAEAAVTGIGADLAIDGIDEVLTVMLGRGRPDPEASGAVVVVRSGGKDWSVHLDTEAVRIDQTSVEHPEALLTGEPQSVLLWLWGRSDLYPDSSFDNSARHPAAVELRARLARAT